MFKLRLSLVVALILLAAACSAGPHSSWSELYISGATVNQLIERETKGQQGFSPIVRLVNEGRSFCTAAVISDSLAVTAEHCLAAPELWIANEKGDVITRATPIGAYERMDFALIEGDFSRFRKFKVVKNADELMKANLKSLVACGYPLNGALSCTKVKLHSQFYFNPAGSANLFPGMSGGPLFDTETLTVIAVNSAVTEQGVAIFGPLLNIFDFIQLTPAQEEPEPEI